MKGGTAKAICALSAFLSLAEMPQTGIGCVLGAARDRDELGNAERAKLH
jgi:hypothetical protein